MLSTRAFMMGKPVVLMAPIVCLVSVLVMCDLIDGAPEKDLITNLPGLTFQPTFKQYSGYLQALEGKLLHYWFVESENDPETDPVVVWLNGGPGCSSLFGLLGENGPLRVTEQGTVIHNEFAWTKVANMLYLEAPAGVGFSYSKSKNYSTDDEDTAKNNFAALQDFFKNFPKYRHNDFYITGESYAGVYIPTLVSLIIDSEAFNLKGFMIGNSWSSRDLNENSRLYFIAYHGLASQKEFSDLLTACCPDKDTSNCSFTSGVSHEKCAMMIQKVHQGLNNLDQYNIYATTPSQERESCDPMLNFQNQVSQQAVLGNTNRPINVQTCNRRGNKFERYLNLPKVRQALHIPPGVQRWIQCSGIPYKWTHTTMFPEYQKAMKTKLRIMLFNGDVDAVCNYLGDEWFADVLHPNEYPEYRQWFYQPSNETRQVGGYYKSFQRFTFATVRGSGHMVPQDRPLPALTMFKMYLADQFN